MTDWLQSSRQNSTVYTQESRRRTRYVSVFSAVHHHMINRQYTSSWQSKSTKVAYRSNVGQQLVSARPRRSKVWFQRMKQEIKWKCWWSFISTSGFITAIFVILLVNRHRYIVSERHNLQKNEWRACHMTNAGYVARCIVGRVLSDSAADQVTLTIVWNYH